MADRVHAEMYAISSCRSAAELVITTSRAELRGLVLEVTGSALVEERVGGEG